MAIKKRKSIPQPQSTPTASCHDDDEKYDARHPHLQGLRQDVYYFVRTNPNCTRDDVSRGINLKSSTCTARIKELIDEGFLFETGETKRNTSGVNAKVLQATSRKSGGKPLDKVRIELTLTIDCNSRYGVTARVVGGLPQSTDSVHAISTKRVTVTAPHPDTYKDVLRDDLAPNEAVKIGRMEIEATAEDIIEADFTVLSD